MATLKHLTLGKLGLYATDSADLSAAINTLIDAGYTVTDIEDDPTNHPSREPWHVATISYTGGWQAIIAIKQLLS